MHHPHSRRQLEIRRLGMEKLFCKVSFRLGSGSRLVEKLMSKDHAQILGGMLEDEVLPLSEASRSFEGSEGDEGRKKALADSAVPFPAPTIYFGLQRAIRKFKGRNLSSKAYGI